MIRFLELLQALIHKLEVETGSRRLNYLALLVAVGSLAVWYDTHCYHNFDSAEAMDAAQLGRNLAEGRGFTTDYIRPLDIYLLQQHNGILAPNLPASTNVFEELGHPADFGFQAATLAAAGQAAGVVRLDGDHPDLANAPLYPLVLAGWFKLVSPQWKWEREKPFWSDGGQFQRYKPEFAVAMLNQVLLVVVVWLTFLLAKTILDTPAAWLVSVLMIGSDNLWRASVSGLPTLMLLVIFLALVWCLVKFQAQMEAGNPDARRLFQLAAGIGLLVGLGMLTRYAFGWLILPAAAFLALFGGTRRTGLAVVAGLACALVVAPWVIRNWAVCGLPFGTAGFAVVQDTIAFPGMRLMHSLTPDLTSAFWLRPYLVKLVVNLRPLLEDDVPRLAGGWTGILFLAGLLLGLRKPVARRLRYFTLMCLGVCLIVTAMGRGQDSTMGPSTENQLGLLTPLVMIFGVAFFLTLLNEMAVPSIQMRYGIVGVVGLMACLPLIGTLLPPRTPPTAFPPYYPPEIQRFSVWIQPEELMMSDVPWAVAWYGHRQCTWTTLNANREFFQFNDYVKHISALYLTINTLDARLLSECMQGGVNSWGSFVFEHLAVYKIKSDDAADTIGRVYFQSTPNEAADHFPLLVSPTDIHVSGLFLTDHERWKTE